MKYESIKHSFLVILIATTIVGCAGNSVQPPASQYQTSSESFDSRGDTSSIDFEDVDKEEMAKQESENSPANLGKKVGETIIGIAACIVVCPLLVLFALAGGGM
jgi:hypothetical protein